MFGALGSIILIWWGISQLIKWIHEWRAAWVNNNNYTIFYDAACSESPEAIYIFCDVHSESPEAD